MSTKFFWVRLDGDTVWTLAEKIADDAWSVIGSDVTFYDVEIAEIGPEVTRPDAQ